MKTFAWLLISTTLVAALALAEQKKIVVVVTREVSLAQLQAASPGVTVVKAIDSRRLAGAGLGVTNPERLRPGHPLWKFDNVLITPHVAGQSDGIEARRMELLTENIKRFAAGEPLLNVVDKVKGY